MKLSTLFLATALAALPLFASAQMAEPFTPPAGLHPHAQPTQHEILGDNALPQQSQKQFSSDVLTTTSDCHARSFGARLRFIPSFTAVQAFARAGFRLCENSTIHPCA